MWVFKHGYVTLKVRDKAKQCVLDLRSVTSPRGFPNNILNFKEKRSENILLMGGNK